MSIASVNPVSKRVLAEKPDIHGVQSDDDIELLFGIYGQQIYNSELLSAFKMTAFDEKRLGLRVKQVFETVWESSDHQVDRFKAFVTSKAAENYGGDVETTFVTMFSYHFFHVTHLCLRDFFETGTIAEDNLNAVFLVGI
jgi:hypothetical protein